MADRQHIAGLPLFDAGPTSPPPVFDAGAPFWRALDELAPDDRLTGQLDQLLAGASAPRVWLLLHEPGQPELSAVAALMLSRALVGRGQNVLVLDVDEIGAALTIWTEREETEGWIDVARFGASVVSAGVPLPFRGGRGTLLGVGSFVPTDVTEDEIISLMGRLRHQADDILLVAAVGPAALPWARRAERRLFCWDRSVRGVDQLGPVTGPFAASGVPLTGLVGYGSPVVVAEPAPAVPAPAAPALAPEPVPEPVPEPMEVPTVATGVPDRPELPPEVAVMDEPEPAPPAASPSVPEPAPEPVAVAVPVPESAGEPAGSQGDKPARGPTRYAHDIGAERESPRGTPRLFWLATGVFAAALVAIAWYWSSYVRVPAGGYFEPVVTLTEPAPKPDTSATADLQRQPADTSAGLAETADTHGVAEAGGLASIGDTLPVARKQEAAASPTTSQTTAPAATGATAGGAGGNAAPFDPAVYKVPAGQAGWALHVYSLPDSAGAAKQIDELERAGYRTAVRIVEIREKGGRWWRLYVGSFPSRSAARAAMPALLSRLGATWAEPARIQESAP